MPSRLRAVIAALGLLSFQPLATAAGLAGRSVAEALQVLQSDDLHFVFSSQVLPSTLRVADEPAGRSPLDTAKALLAPHGLELRAVEPGLWAVVQGARPSPPPAPADDPALAELVISASRYALGALSTSPAVRIAGDALSEQPGLGNDPLRAIERLPGFATNGLSTRSNVRGGDASETLLLLDGFPLRQPYHLAGYQSLFSVLDAGLIESAEVFTGGFPARYGNRMAGVFDLTSIAATTEPRRSVGVDFFNATARAAGSVGSTRAADWLASARIGTLKPLLSAVAPKSGTPTYSDVFLKGGIGDESMLRLTANVLWSRDELNIRNERRGESAQIEGRVRYAWLQAQREWTPAIETALWLGQTRIESLRQGVARQPGVVDASVEDARSAQLTDLRGRMEWRLAERHYVESGFEYVAEHGDYRYAGRAQYSPAVALLFGRSTTLANEADLSPHRDRGTLFAAYRWQMADDLTTEIGWRMQRLVTRNEEGGWIEDPRIGLHWRVAPRTRLRLNFGYVHQVAEINELQVEDGRSQFDGTQRVEQAIVGLEHEVDDHLKLRAELYDKRQPAPRLRFENLLNAQTILAEVAPDRVAVQPTFARMRGAEISAEYSRARWSAWASGVWSRAIDTFADRQEFRSWDQTWTFSGGARWQHGRWQHMASLELHRGWPTTPLWSGPTGATLGPRNSGRLRLFAELDLRTEYVVDLGEGRLALTGELMNAQGRANDCCSQLEVVDGALTRRNLKWFPAIPSLGIRWDF